MGEAAEQTAEFDVDKTMEELSAAAPERAMTSETPEETPAAPTWDGKQWEFDWNGKKVVPDSADKLRIWASQGYNYSQRMGELNKTHAQRMAEAEQRARAAGELEQRFSPYARVDEYAKKNPAWWQHTLQAFEQAQRGGGQPGAPGAPDPRYQALEQKLGSVEQVLGQWQQAQAEAQNQQEDQALDQEIGEIRAKYPNIDLNATDPQSGETLELRVLKHARQIGTGSFRVAFRDYLHDKLVGLANASGREAIAKDAASNARKGILGKTPAPAKGIQPAQNVRGKSYNALAQEALAEFGINS